VLGRALGFLVACVPTNERRIAALQMDIFLRKEGGRRHLRRMYASLGQSFFEFLNLKPMLDNPERYIESPTRAVIDAVVARGKPIITLSAHTSNWDLLAAYVSRMGLACGVIARVARSREVQAILAEMRASYGVTSGLKAIIRQLRERKILAALIDQDTQVTSVFVPFFGRMAKSPSALVELGKKYGAVIVSTFIVRTGFCRYAVIVEEIDPSLSVEEILSIYNARLEALIRRYPEQWVWMHKRWRSTPDGRILSSRDYIGVLKEELGHAHS
jgi:Kdo2-lipid IVA lauroyltransferase/acyltransferase